MPHRRLSRGEVAFLIGVPLAWAVLLLFHPTGEGDDFYPVVSRVVSRWVVVHVGTLLFIPLIAAVVYRLLAGVEGRAARVSRVALASFVLFYATWEALVGIGLGLFVDEVNGLPAAEQAGGRTAVEDFADSGTVRAFELIGTGSLFVALAAGGTALRRQTRASLAVPALLVLAAVPIAWHVPPFGQVGLGLFAVAVVLLVRANPARPLPAGAA